MDRRIGYTLRAGAAAIGVSTALMVVASTAQTPDGFIHASLGGPLDIFSNPSSEVLAIGDGPDDATELAALLNTPVEALNGNPDSPLRVVFDEWAEPNGSAPTILPAPGQAGERTAKQSLQQIPRAVVDAQGRVDCTGSVSCAFDPTTKVTTVTYPDGVVAMVQKVNDLTVVAYKTAAENLRTQVQTFLGLSAAAEVPTPLAAAAAPVPATAPVSPPPPASPTAETLAPVINPGPPAPKPVLTDPTAERPGPRVNVTRPPMDFTPGRDTDPRLPSVGNGPTPKLPNLDTVKDAFDSVADAVGDAVDRVGKAIGAGASEKPATDKPANDKPTADKAESE